MVVSVLISILKASIGDQHKSPKPDLFCDKMFSRLIYFECHFELKRTIAADPCNLIRKQLLKQRPFLPQLHSLIIIQDLCAQHIIIFRLDKIDIGKIHIVFGYQVIDRSAKASIKTNLCRTK